MRCVNAIAPYFHSALPHRVHLAASCHQHPAHFPTRSPSWVSIKCQPSASLRTDPCDVILSQLHRFLKFPDAGPPCRLHCKSIRFLFFAMAKKEEKLPNIHGQRPAPICNRHCYSRGRWILSDSPITICPDRFSLVGAPSISRAIIFHRRFLMMSILLVTQSCHHGQIIHALPLPMILLLVSDRSN